MIVPSKNLTICYFILISLDSYPFWRYGLSVKKLMLMTFYLFGYFLFHTWDTRGKVLKAL